MSADESLKDIPPDCLGTACYHSDMSSLIGLLGAKNCQEHDEGSFARTILLTRVSCFKDNYTAVRMLRTWKEVVDDLIKACEYIFPPRRAKNEHTD